MDEKFVYLTPLIVFFGAAIIHKLLTSSPSDSTRKEDIDGESESVHKSKLNQETNSNTDDDNTTDDVSISSSSIETIRNTDIALCIGKDDVKLLLALLHAANCINNKCNVLPDDSCCHDMKLLYKHSKNCKKICEYDNCYISRALLSHYARCQDLVCQICLPTRLSLHNRNIYVKPRKRSIVSSVALE